MRWIRFLTDIDGFPIKANVGDIMPLEPFLLRNLEFGVNWEFATEQENPTEMDRAVPPHFHPFLSPFNHNHDALYVPRLAGASPPTPVALTGTLGTTGTTLTQLTSTWNAAAATIANNDFRRLMDAYNLLRSQLEIVRARLVETGIWSS